MANNRISAAQKDNIKRAYQNKISKLEAEKKEIVRKLLDLDLIEYNSSNLVEQYKSISEQLFNYVEKVDPKHDLIHYQILRALNDVIDGDSIFKSSSYSDLTYRYYDNNKEVQELTEKQTNLNKELNKLLWNIEMAPKSSEEYKNAYSKAEEILFGNN